jgi:signal transduction histidine kinase
MVVFHFALFSLFTAIVCTIVGFIPFLKNRELFLNKIWLFLNLATALWGFGVFIAHSSYNKDTVLAWSRIHDASAIFIPSFYLHFVLELLKTNDKKKRICFKSCYGISLFLFIFSFSSLFIKDVGRQGIFKYYLLPGPLYFLFILFFGCTVIYALVLLIKSIKSAKGYEREQLKYVLIASFIGFGGGATDFLPVYNISIFPFGNYIVFIYPIIITYAIVRYRLMDIKVAITRTGIFIAVYTLVLGLPFAIAGWFKHWLIDLLGPGWWMLPLGLMAGLATVGPFIYIYLDRKAEERLLKEQKRYQDTLKQASVGMTRIRNLRKLLDMIAHIVTKTVRISYAAIYLYNSETDEYVLQVSRDKGRISVPNITAKNPLITWITLKRVPLVYEEVKRQMQDSPDQIYQHLEESMRLLTASVVIPSFLEDRLMGFIVLGDKLSGQIYTPEDLNVFQVLASQAALAIENAQFYEEAKEMQEQIAQAEKMATIGTMADGLSHQINNRFYALSLIAGDTMDTIKMTDTANCTPEVRDMLKQINHALDRIQVNVMQGGEVVKGILKYTRRGEDGLDAVILDQVIDGTLEMVQYKVRLSEIDIIRDYPKDTPKIKGNLIQLQEAFFNFIDNAYDATVERRDLLKEAGYRGRITISARPKDSMLEIVVEDNGMGIKEADMKKVFTPFFTTKVSSRKGTGLGLFVIKRLITDNHKGKVNVESEHRIGTRFIVELPIAS